MRIHEIVSTTRKQASDKPSHTTVTFDRSPHGVYMTGCYHVYDNVTPSSVARLGSVLNRDCKRIRTQSQVHRYPTWASSLWVPTIR